MRVYYDTEFLEDGRTIDLISIGMVAEDGRELYAVNEEAGDGPLHDRICEHQWLMENVVPSLPLRRSNGLGTHSGLSNRYAGYFFLDQDDNTVMPRRMIRNQVRDFLQATPDLELWAWYAAYDHVALAQLFGRMLALPDGVPMWTNDLRQETHRLGNPELPEQAEGEHNALADARHNRDVAQALAALVPAATFPAPKTDPWPFKPDDVVGSNGPNEPAEWLDDAPVGTVLCDTTSDSWTRYPAGWQSAPDTRPLNGNELHTFWGPLVVVSVGKEEA